MAVKLATGVKVVMEGEDGGPAVRLLILNQTTVNGWVESLHVDLDQKATEALALLLLSKAAQLREIREATQNRDSRGLFQQLPSTWSKP